MIQKIETKISGCYALEPFISKDLRGSFIKTFHEKEFTALGLTIDFAEEYYSISYKNVLRGLHFQMPPKEHKKIVYCVQGEVVDVVVDLRKNSPTYRQSQSFLLSGEKANMLYIPEGLAHGFYVCSDLAIMMYKVTTVYAPEHDSGILWHSVGISWPTKNPIISDRDKCFVELENFYSPF